MTTKTYGVVGLGYVGLPLAMEFCKAGISVVGVDNDAGKVEILRAGGSFIGDVPAADVATAVDAGMFLPTTDFGELRGAETISICVPTPLSKSHDPDMSFVTAAATDLARVIQPGQTVVLESTVYPGATEELMAPILETSSLKAGEDFYLAFSPERIDPGNTKYRVAQIPKVVGGMNEASTARAVESYSRVFEKVIPVGSTREAEMAKLLENTFRAVNIGLVNELAIMAHGMGINIWKVIDAAATKPFGYTPFYPGPGWGGHCIPVDPFYLTWRAKLDGYESGFIEQAGRINGRMPTYVVDRVSELLNERRKPVSGSKVLLVGVAYKRDVSDVRESPAIDIAELLMRRGAHVTYHDPHVESFVAGDSRLASSPLTCESLREQDAVLVLTDHRAVDYRMVLDCSELVFDTRNAVASLGHGMSNVTVL